MAKAAFIIFSVLAALLLVATIFAWLRYSSAKEVAAVAEKATEDCRKRIPTSGECKALYPCECPKCGDDDNVSVVSSISTNSTTSTSSSKTCNQKRGCGNNAGR